MSSDVSRSKPWLNDFFATLASGHGIDFLVVHWYGPRFADMQRFLEDMHATYNLPLWVNEFAYSTMGNGQVSVGQVEAFMREAVPWLDTCPYVERYAYFGHGHEWVGTANEFNEAAQGCEATSGKTLSRIGKLYTQL